MFLEMQFKIICRCIIKCNTWSNQVLSIQSKQISLSVKIKQNLLYLCRYRKTCLTRPLKKDQELVFKTDYRLLQVGSIAECSLLSYHVSLRPLFCPFLSGRSRQVLLYLLYKIFDTTILMTFIHTIVLQIALCPLMPTFVIC